MESDKLLSQSTTDALVNDTEWIEDSLKIDTTETKLKCSVNGCTESISSHSKDEEEPLLKWRTKCFPRKKIDELVKEDYIKIVEHSLSAPLIPPEHMKQWLDSSFQVDNRPSEEEMKRRTKEWKEWKDVEEKRMDERRHELAVLIVDKLI